MRKAVIFDIDGVLAEKSPDRDYRQYNKVEFDKPVEKIFELLCFYYLKNYRSADLAVLFVTGRKDCCREKTIDWLNKYIVQYSVEYGNNDYYYDEMYVLEHSINCQRQAAGILDEYSNLEKKIDYKMFMRGDADYRPAEILKKEIYDNHIKDKYEVIAVFDDDKNVCRMWKEQGLFVFQVISKS